MQNSLARLSSLGVGLLMLTSVAQAEMFSSEIYLSKNYYDSTPGNPIITKKYKADPAAIVYNGNITDAGHDEAPPRRESLISITRQS